MTKNTKRPASMPLAKELQIAARRRKIAKLQTEGISQSEIARRLGVHKATVARDVKYLKNEANRNRLKETVAKYEGVDEEVLDLIPTDREEYKKAIQEAVVELARSEKTTREIALRTGLSLCTISAAVNDYLREVGDFSGRTVDEWRTMELLLLEEQIRKVQQDSLTEEKPSKDGKGWDITPTRAAQIRNQSSKVLIELMYRRDKLLGLDQQKKEVKITREIVHEWAGVDTSAWPKEVEIEEGEWSVVS